jgi:hypothetical protein
MEASTVEADLEQLRRTTARLESVLGRVFSEVRDYPDAPPMSSESYLPPCMVAEIAEALHAARSS